MVCRLCGYEFEEAALVCHSGCPMGSRCNLLCCPNCGYQIVDESKSRLARLLHRLWPKSGRENGIKLADERGPGEGEQLVPLVKIPLGAAVEVARLAGMPASRLTRLSAFGLVPGSRVELLQRRPAPIVRIGETELALSEEILNQIWVSP